MGEAIAGIITRLHRTGTHPQLEAMRLEIPAGVLEMLSVPGLRPDKVLKLYTELGIASLDELQQAALHDRLKPVKGLGAALQAKILGGLKMRREGARHLHRAVALLAAAEANLRESRLGLKRITPAGDFRRGCELVSDLVLVAEAPALEGAPQKTVPSGQLTVHLTDPGRYGITLILATGSQQHVQALRARAAEQGLTLDEHGLRRGRKLLAAKTEEAIYKALGLAFIPAELREGRDEIARPAQTNYRSLLPTRTFEASCTHIPNGRTARTPLSAGGRNPQTRLRILRRGRSFEIGALRGRPLGGRDRAAHGQPMCST